MNKDFVSEINLWCQKNKKPLPNYLDKKHGEQEWEIVANFLEKIYTSGIHPNKKMAKQAVAEKIYNTLNQPNQVYKLNLQGPCCILIDGDNRADCWRFLVDPQTVIPPQTHIIVYMGPSTPIIKNTVDKPNFTLVKTTSPSRDAADAIILMSLGAFIESKKYQKYYIISSDHILVQAALDTPNVDCIVNLSQLKELLL